MEDESDKVDWRPEWLRRLSYTTSYRLRLRSWEFDHLSLCVPASFYRVPRILATFDVFRIEQVDVHRIVKCCNRKGEGRVTKSG